MRSKRGEGLGPLKGLIAFVTICCVLDGHLLACPPVLVTVFIVSFVIAFS